VVVKEDPGVDLDLVGGLGLVEVSALARRVELAERDPVAGHQVTCLLEHLGRQPVGGVSGPGRIDDGEQPLQVGGADAFGHGRVSPRVSADGCDDGKPR
jgi:hypothetical protein